MFSWIHRMCFGKADGGVTSVEATQPIREEEKFVFDLQTVFQDKNILVFCGTKNSTGVSRLVNHMAKTVGKGFYLSNGAISVCCAETVHKHLEKVEHSDESLENILRKQRAALETYNLPPTLMVFDRITAFKNDENVEQIVKDNKELAYTNVFIVSDLCEFPKSYLKHVDAFIFFREKNHRKELARNQAIWDMRYKDKLPFDKFNCAATSDLGAIKANMISDDVVFHMRLALNDIHTNQRTLM
jgi:hypothetical protein